MSERYASGDLKALYTWANGQVVAITSYCQNCGGMGSYDTYYLHADSTGNVISLTDKNGAVAHTYEYDPYGNVISETGKTVENPFKYKGIHGYYTDKETGLIYLQQRYYSPKLMRFLSFDPLNCNCKGEIAQKLTQPLDLNPYTYVMGNPVMAVDPSGMMYKVILKVMQTFNPYYWSKCTAWKMRLQARLNTWLIKVGARMGDPEFTPFISGIDQEINWFMHTTNEWYWAKYYCREVFVAAITGSGY